MDSKIIESYQCSLGRSHIVLIEINTWIQAKAWRYLFGQTQVVRSTRHKNLKIKQNNKYFCYSCIIFGYISPIGNFSCMHVEEILDQPTFWNQLTRLNFSSNNFCCIPPKKKHRSVIIGVICKFLQPGIISSMRIEKKLGHADLTPERIYLYFINLIQNDWKHILRNETFQKSLCKTFLKNNSGNRKIKSPKNFRIKKSTSPFNLITLST